ncbi:MAG: restriction endonuclease subunit S [Sulfuritalea sp.]|nr:restriction endonuclease subunit S [Sulfuritalea sp.]
MSVVLSQQLPLLASAPDGIQKLRGLILELAVRGKLVPQNPSDEPASELLKRIAKERKELAIKQQVPADDGNLFPLAAGWQWVRFGDVAQHNSGKTLDKGRNTGQARRYITTSNLYWGQFELSSVREMLIRDDELERCTARKNDLLICEGGEAGRAAVWESGEEVCFQNHIHRARFFGGINPYYAYRVFQRLDLSGEINKFRKGVGISNLSGRSLASIPFPLPPLAEQNRVVAKVDELMALCDRLEQEVGAGETAHAKLVETLLGTLTQSTDADDLAANWQRLSAHFDTLFTNEVSIDALKQTILQLAVMGKLVPQEPNDEPASEILGKIRKTRNTLYATKNISKPKELPALDDSELPFSLPNGWIWCMLGDLCYQVSDGPHFSPQYVTAKEGVPFLSTRNVRPDGFDLASLKYVSRADHEEFCKRIRPEKGDVIYTKGGTTGIAKVNDLDFEFSVWVHLAVLRIEKNRLLPRYVELALNSPHCYAQSQHYTQGISNFDLGLTRMIKITTPLPPLAEQHRIVAKVDELMALCDQLKADLAESRTRQDRLAKTLIEAALMAA